MAEQSLGGILDEIEAGFPDLLVAGVLDSQAQLLDIRKGRSVKFDLPPERQEILNIQLSLLFSLLNQLQDVSGDHKFTFLHFTTHDLLLMSVSSHRLFIITEPSQNVPSQVTKLLEIVNMQQKGESGPRPMPEANFIHYYPVNIKTEEGMKAPPQKQQVEKSRGEQSAVNTQSGRRSRPESILMLQGYLKGLSGGFAIEESYINEPGVSGGRDRQYYKIKAREASDRFDWSMIEKLESLFGDQIAIHSVTKDDKDGRLVITISPKEKESQQY